MRLNGLKYLFVLSLFATAAVDCCAQNFWKRVANKNNTEVSKIDKAKSKSKTTVVSPLELTLDENLLTPVISNKDNDVVSRHMKLLAKRLSDRKIERIETMRKAEVVVATFAMELLFAPNDTVLRSKANEILSPYKSLVAGDNWGRYKLVLASHTDNTGSDRYNDWLSETRVNAVYDLLTNGSSDKSELIIPYALGSSEPLKSNLSRQGRATNRRLEIYIVPTTGLLKHI